MLTLQQSQNIVSTLNSKKASNTSNINVTSIINALKHVKATTFAGLTQASKVKTAAAHKAEDIYKITVQQVTLCNSDASLYNNAVTREVVKTNQASEFESLPSNYVMINDSYSVCALKSNTNKHYLRAIVNNASEVVYYCNTTNKFLTKQEVSEYLTASASKALLNPPKTNEIKHAEVEHNVTIRNFGLENIYSINLAKQSLTA